MYHFHFCFECMLNVFSVGCEVFKRLKITIQKSPKTLQYQQVKPIRWES